MTTEPGECEDISLDRFIELEKDKLESFRALWRNGARENPERWPCRMPVGEWDEQLWAFRQSIEDSERS